MTKARARRAVGEVRQRGGKWEARWYDPDGNRRSRRFTDKAMAQEFATQQQLDARRAREGRGTYLDPAKKAPLFREVALAWLQTSPGRAPRTRMGYASHVHHRLIPAFGSTRIDKITPTEIKRFIAQQEREGRSLATIKSYLRTLSPIFEMAIDDEHLVRNPVKRVKFKAPVSKRATIINPSQVKLLASVANPVHVTLILFAAYTGLRAGELAALKWRHLNLKTLSVTVETSATEIPLRATRRELIDLGTEDRVHYGDTKNHRSRVVRFPSFLVPLLGEPGGRDELVFRMPMGGRMRWETFRARTWLPAVAAAHEADPTFPATLRFHDLRHTAASVLIAAGYNPKAIQVHMGHSSIQVTYDIYGHLLDDWHADLPDVLDKIHSSAPTLTVIDGGKRSIPPRRKTA